MCRKEEGDWGRGRRGGIHLIWQMSKRWSSDTNADIWKKSLPLSFCTIHLLIPCLSFSRPAYSFSPDSFLNPASTLRPSPMTHPHTYACTGKKTPATLRLCFGKALRRPGLGDVTPCVCECLAAAGGCCQRGGWWAPQRSSVWKGALFHRSRSVWIRRANVCL